MAMTVLWIWVAAGVVLGLPLFLWAIGRCNNQPWEDWEYLLDAKGARAYRQLKRSFQQDREMVDYAYGKAFGARYRGSAEDVARLLDVGYRFLAEVAHDRRELLAQMAAYSRMISGLVPSPPVRPAAFRLASVGSMATAAFVLHWFLVTAAERFQLRVQMLRAGFSIVLASMLWSGRRAMQGNPDTAWERINAGREDFHALTDESLESLRILLLSLAAERERQVVLHRV